ncbi:MAG: hypothetical protein ACMUEM_03360 [Flavobacteriales bacterium AspAUS03]
MISDLRKEGLNIVTADKGPRSVTADISTLQNYQIILTDQIHHAKE